MWLSWTSASLAFQSFLIASALEWSSSPRVGEVTNACAGSDVSIPWSFTSDTPETILDVTWYSERSKENQTVLATFISGQFFSSSTTIVQYVPNAGLLLRDVMISDAGLYTVRVHAYNASHVTESSRFTHVEIAAPPAGTQLHAHRRPLPVKDDVTGTWHVVLECGEFTDLGQPSVRVQWQTPSGSAYPSSSYQEGYFLLSLNTSAETGNYSCSILHQSPARQCLASDSPLLGEATVYVDGDDVRMTLLEANEQQLFEGMWQEDEDLASQLRRYQEQLQQLDRQQASVDMLHQPATCRDVQRYDNDSVVHVVFHEGTNISVYCDQVTDGGGWMVIQRRQDGSEDFYRNWTDYKQGFGNLRREFWLGLDNMHVLTSARRHELRVDLEDFDGNQTFAVYSGFTVGNESTGFKLRVDNFTGGDAGDSLMYHNGQEFATKDHGRPRALTCALKYHGAWWYNDCYNSNLNGVYITNAPLPHLNGVTWFTFRQSYRSLKRAEMKIRPV
ncbi:angiopoietin-related protein 7-like isoform X2 [Pomacea canaliculata]|uniref:angiopoietin-related protein 7-like isoform X2 n=1 Tax=Pomacea canaliculata TaxID=400727 RepID=UPI000D73446A|nr:angiopoietin-related protein 7-like isoform X2 [Pomacea canaliculata]